MENLLECNGRKFRANILGTPCEGIISVEANEVFLCQDKKDGFDCSDKKGYRYSWCYMFESGRLYSSVTDFELLADEPKEGDYVYVSQTNPRCDDNQKRIFIAKSKNFYLCVDSNHESQYKNGTRFNVITWNFGKLISKEDLITEITADEALEIVAKQKGIDVKNLRIKK